MNAVSEIATDWREAMILEKIDAFKAASARTAELKKLRKELELDQAIAGRQNDDIAAARAEQEANAALTMWAEAYRKRNAYALDLLKEMGIDRHEFRAALS